MFTSKKIIRILLISLLLMLVFSSTASAAKKVAIKTPSDGAEVSGLVTISGTGSGADTESLLTVVPGRPPTVENLGAWIGTPPWKRTALIQ